MYEVLERISIPPLQLRGGRPELAAEMLAMLPIAVAMTAAASGAIEGGSLATALAMMAIMEAIASVTAGTLAAGAATAAVQTAAVMAVMQAAGLGMPTCRSKYGGRSDLGIEEYGGAGAGDEGRTGGGESGSGFSKRWHPNQARSRRDVLPMLGTLGKDRGETNSERS